MIAQIVDTRVVAARDDCINGWRLYVRDYDRDAKQVHCYTDKGRVPVGANDPMQPLAQLTHAMAQELLDNLWRGGVRPTEQAPTEGCLAAMQAHIDTLREAMARTMSQHDLAKTLR